jgi:hypothetical protein
MFWNLLFFIIKGFKIAFLCCANRGKHTLNYLSLILTLKINLMFIQIVYQFQKSLFLLMMLLPIRPCQLLATTATPTSNQRRQITATAEML